jgi:hypothetical protein
MRATLGERFKILLLDAGLTPEQARKELHVTPRTIRYWISGKVLVPYAAFRLMRILRFFELPQPGWDGWHMHSGRLWSPEGFSFKPDDASWWHLLVRRADGFGRQYARANQLDAALKRSGGSGDEMAVGGRTEVRPHTVSASVSSTFPQALDTWLGVTENAPALVISAIPKASKSPRFSSSYPPTSAGSLSQAGVVAPPDSPNSRTFASLPSSRKPNAGAASSDIGGV